MSKVTRTTPTLLTQEQSKVPGFIESIAVTDEDRLIEIAAISNMMQSDLLTLQEACNEISSTLKSFKTMKLANNISEALHSLHQYSKDILRLTKKKSSTEYTTNRQRSYLNYEEKKRIQRRKQSPNFTDAISIKRTLFDKVENIAKKKPKLASDVTLLYPKRNLPRSCKQMRMQNDIPTSKSKKARVPPVIQDSKCPFTFHLSKIGKVAIPPPSYDKTFFTLKELIISLKDLPSPRRIIDALHKSGHCLFTHSSFEYHLSKYKSSGILPKEDNLGGKAGRPPIIEFNNIIEKLNHKHKDNTGFIAS